MKFKNKTTGAILETNSKFVIEQMEKSVQYEKVEDKPKKKKGE